LAGACLFALNWAGRSADEAGKSGAGFEDRQENNRKRTTMIITAMVTIAVIQSFTVKSHIFIFTQVMRIKMNAAISASATIAKSST